MTIRTDPTDSLSTSSLSTDSNSTRSKPRVRPAASWWAQRWRRLATAGEHTLHRLSNLRRRWFKRRLPDYVVVTLDSELLERDPSTPWYYELAPGYRKPLTLEGIRRILDRIADDPDVRGVLFFFKGATLSLAQAQSLTALFERFRQWSLTRHRRAAAQRVVVYVESCSPSALVAASAADQLIFSPLTEWSIVGLRTAPLFVKETLARLGVEMQVVRVAPWKTAADRFIFDGLSDAARAQAQWLLDSLYADIVAGVAQGRRLEAATVQALIDRAPLNGAEALAAGLIDQLAYEDELPDLLKEGDTAAVLKPFGRVSRWLYRRMRPTTVGAVGVITLSGTILTGASRSFPAPLPLFGDETIGSATAQQIIRAARQDASLDAVVVHVDSPGGSALASDLIWRELALLDQEKPVVIYMGDVAASGGYYIAVAGRKIVAQRASLTGSIGVIIAKANLQGAFAKAGARRDAVSRGAHASIYADTTRWQGDLLARVEASLQHVYTQFKQRVIDGRKLDPAMLDDLAGGRVWTGAQAQAHGLVDLLGDFDQAVELAAAEAGLPAGGRVDLVAITEPPRWLPPAPALAAWLAGRKAQQAVELATFLLDGELSSLLACDQVWLLAPHLPRS